MFHQLFTHPAIIQKHLDGPFADVRRRYLEDLVTSGYARSTVLRHASYSLCVAKALADWPRLLDDVPIEIGELEVLATRWAGRRLRRLARAVRIPRRSFLQLARALLMRLDRLAAPAADPLSGRVSEFAEAYAEVWTSPNTRRSMALHVLRFLRFVESRGVPCESASYADIDAFLHDRRSCCRIATMKLIVAALRAWFSYAPSRGWAIPGLAVGIWQPRVYALAGLLPGPTPDQVRAAIEGIRGYDHVVLRDRAIFLLIAVYGLRACEVCTLRLEDIDWAHDRLYVTRAKGGPSGWVPLEVNVGTAIAQYIRKARPRSPSRSVFLRARAPFRALSTCGLYNIVAHHLRAVAHVPVGRGPHGLRHASARILLASGASLKTIGDHLGQRSPEATAIYAKVDAQSLRQVAWTDVEGLA